MIYDDQVEVLSGTERRAATVRTGVNNERFIVSPFTGTKLDLPPLTEPPNPILQRHINEHRRLAARLERSRRCPDTLPERLRHE